MKRNSRSQVPHRTGAKKRPTQTVEPGLKRTEPAMPGNVAEERVQRARRILRSLGDPPPLIPAWITFNALYGKSGGERSDLMAFVQAHISDEQSQAILNHCVESLHYFAAIPPGDMRLGYRHPGFRRRTAEDLAKAMNIGLLPSVRLSHLVAAVYQVRCNLFHGQKDIQNPRARQLVDHSYRIVQDVLDLFI